MVQKLEWESAFFKTNCAQFYPDRIFEPNNLDEYDWVQGKCLINDELSKAIFGNNKFVFEDTRVIFEKELQAEKLAFHSNIEIKRSSIGEIDSLSAIAKEELTEHSRLLILVGKEQTEKFYAEWVKKAVLGTFDDISFTIKVEREPVGFITLKYSNTEPKIGLIAIKRKLQGYSLGKKLIHFAENFLIERNHKSLQVITEGRNIRAQQFYIKYGFNITNIECWYYRMKKSAKANL